MDPAKLPSNLMLAEWQAADPVNGAVIDVSKFGHYSFATGASGETNTLPNPSKEGIVISLLLRSDGGGDRVITAAGAINRTGNTIMTFADARDFIQLESVMTDPSPETYRWQVISNDGVALS